MSPASDNLLSRIESRDAALWIRGLPVSQLSQEMILSFLGLPWLWVLSELSDPKLIQALEEPSNSIDYMTRKRGFIQIVDSDPGRVQFPQRCLPIYLLNGREGNVGSDDFKDRLRRLTIVESLRRSSVREIVIISTNADPIPSEIDELWSSGFKSNLTFVSDLNEAKNSIEGWARKTGAMVSLSRLSTAQFFEDLFRRYTTRYPEDRQIVRVRDRRGEYHKVDITEIDDPEHPILEQYTLVLDRDLSPIQPEELAESEFITFFQNPNASWRPYAAGLPWPRSSVWTERIDKRLQRLNFNGPDENCILYISSESGAGGTTTIRTLAWKYANDGYPVLFANPIRFVPNSLSISNFLFRANRKFKSEISIYSESKDLDNTQLDAPVSSTDYQLYEVPWIIIYDRSHWEFRDTELRRFFKEIQKSGRPVCLIMVTNSIIESSFLDNTPLFQHVGRLDHALDIDEARRLGLHLNKFLRVFGKQRPQWQWEKFYNDHTIRLLEGFSHFWITLSFWIQRQYDLTESIQQWMYKIFKDNIQDEILREAILGIAAMSSERLPTPEILLPESKGEWPISHMLEESRTEIPAIGLMAIKEGGVRYWAFIHDILGRFLINAIFYDFQTRKELGFTDAKDPEHLRFILLRGISKKSQLGEQEFKTLGEDFATIVFKIDPDHGRAGFAYFWREVLAAIDAMPQSLRNNSRVFRHHAAISRRRIAKLNGDLYNISDADRIALLEQAINDITYAVTYIDYTPGSEPDINLFNSLARAYLDLADVLAKQKGDTSRIAELRNNANDAARKAYNENPKNSFVLETYVRNLIEAARDDSNQTINRCIEALSVLFSAISSNEESYRRSQLGILADEVLDLLLSQVPPDFKKEPTNPTDLLLMAWAILAKDVEYSTGIALSEIPDITRKDAIEILSNPIGAGNMQVLRMRYQLICVTYPEDMKSQLDIIEQIENSEFGVDPQQKLEYAILLYQNNRAREGGELFRQLRNLWRESEQFVYVPERLRWLVIEDGKTLKKVTGTIGSDYAYKTLALVQNFNNQKVPFRPEEFSLRNIRPGTRITCHVSFGHNGPFLRPVNTGPDQND